MSASNAEGDLDPSGARELVIAGWTGRDAARVEAHVRELEAEGIPRPPRTPMFYGCRLDSSRSRTRNHGDRPGDQR